MVCSGSHLSHVCLLPIWCLLLGVIRSAGALRLQGFLIGLSKRWLPLQTIFILYLSAKLCSSYFTSFQSYDNNESLLMYVLKLCLLVALPPLKCDDKNAWHDTPPSYILLTDTPWNPYNLFFKTHFFHVNFISHFEWSIWKSHMTSRTYLGNYDIFLKEIIANSIKCHLSDTWVYNETWELTEIWTKEVWSIGTSTSGVGFWNLCHACQEAGSTQCYKECQTFMIT